MTNQNVINQSPQFRLLSDEQLGAIHYAALEILRRTGVSVLEPQALDVLKKACADVDGNHVKIQPHLVEWAIRTAPSRVVLCDSRNGKPRIFLEDKNAYYGTGSDTIAVIDRETGERRLPLLDDVAQAAKLCDALPNIDFVMSMGIASDVPEEISDLYLFQAMASNTNKPMLVTAWNQENMEENSAKIIIYG